MFPLYLGGLAAAVVLRTSGVLPVSVFVPSFDASHVLVNVTILQEFWGSRSILSVA
ncbi:MAG: hypothetical protein NVS2B7_06400 [Herpetosiphon sp.]